MCPDKKLKWFKDRGQNARQIKDIKKRVVDRWNETYRGEVAPASAPCATRAGLRSKVNEYYSSLMSN